MDRTPTRRQMLGMLGAGAATLAGCTGTQGAARESTPAETPTPTATPTETPTDSPTTTEEETETATEEPWEIEPVEHDRLVGAFYYPWYHGEEGWAGDPGGAWTDDTPATPELGAYDSRDEDVVNQHIKWAREHGINWFLVNGHHPGGRKDVTTRRMMDAELADHMDFALEFVVPNPLKDDGVIDFDDAAVRDELRRQFQHYHQHYFDRDNYLHVDDRPLLFFYNPAHRGDLPAAFDAARGSIPEDPYIIADGQFARQTAEPFWPLDIDDIAYFDAIGDYNIYPPLADDDAFSLDTVDEQYRRWRILADDHDTAFMPMLLPGYDTTQRGFGDPVPTHDRSPEFFREFARTARKYMDPDLDAVLITSWNEWPEYTSVEPAESYGTTYLDIIEDELARTEPDRFDPASYIPLELDFDTTVDPNPDDQVDRSLAVMLTRLDLHGDTGTSEYDIGGDTEPFYTEGIYRAEDNGDTTWRWTGGPTGTTRILHPPDTPRPDTITLTGRPIADDITAQVHYDGEPVGELTFDDGRGEYSVQVA